MTDDKKNEKPTPAKATPELRDVPRGIPVKFMRLVRITQLPGHQSTDSVKAEKAPDGRVWEIEYIAQMRHHRITYTNPNKEGDSRVAFVHETHVSMWEPAAL